MNGSLQIVGASARAAAFSALRAGLRPSCADLFADTDLAARCPVQRISADDYPHAFLDVLASAPRCPWMYTGGLESRPALVESMARLAPLWGNGRHALQCARDPFLIASLLQEYGLPVPPVRRLEQGEPPAGRWLLKSRASAGGAGVRRWEAGTALPHPASRFYLQKFIEGDSFAAVFVAFEKTTLLLGVTRQLVGVPWLHAPEFHYCGSVAIEASRALQDRLLQLGDVLAEACGLRGLFGIDFILQDDSPYPVEINPRYPASVEVVEQATGIAALALHRAVFDPDASLTPLPSPGPTSAVGKAILFARGTLTFPASEMWKDASRFADVPAAGEVIPAGGPIGTLFCRGQDERECLEALRIAANEMTHFLEVRGP